MPITASDWSQIAPTNNGVPVTIPSAATISPVSYHTILTGNVAIATIVPPVVHTHQLAIEFAGTGGVVATGNILTAKASVVGMIMLLIYNPTLTKYVPVG